MVNIKWYEFNGEMLNINGIFFIFVLMVLILIFLMFLGSLNFVGFFFIFSFFVLLVEIFFREIIKFVVFMVKFLDGIR